MRAVVSPFSSKTESPEHSKDAIEAQVLEFVRRGGKIKQIPHGASHDPNSRQIRLGTARSRRSRGQDFEPTPPRAA